MNLLTIDDIALRYHVTPRAVRNWCDSGALKAQKIAGIWIIEADALDDFVRPKIGRPSNESRSKT